MRVVIIKVLFTGRKPKRLQNIANQLAHHKEC